MLIKHPQYKAPACSNLHKMIREKCEDYFDALEDVSSDTFEFDDDLECVEDVFEQDLAAIGKIVVEVHYGDSYLAFIETLKKQNDSKKEED